MSEQRSNQSDVEAALRALLAERVLVIDGAMGTEIQKYKLTEADFRGQRFAGHGRDLKGNNDLLTLTRPDVIRAIHDSYLAAGADIIESNTFYSNSLPQSDYGLEALAYELNREAAGLARAAADAATAATGRRRFVAGAIGPTNRTLSISPQVNDPSFRAVTFDQVRDAYAEQVRGLLDGGVDLLLAETVYLDGLPRPFAHCAALDEWFNLSGAANADVRASFLALALHSDYAPALALLSADAPAHPLATGRLQLLRPIYAALAAQPATRALAGHLYRRYRSGYHPVARHQLETLLRAHGVATQEVNALSLRRGP